MHNPRRPLCGFVDPHHTHAQRPTLQHLTHNLQTHLSKAVWVTYDRLASPLTTLDPSMTHATVTDTTFGGSSAPYTCKWTGCGIVTPPPTTQTFVCSIHAPVLLPEDHWRTDQHVPVAHPIHQTLCLLIANPATNATNLTEFGAQFAILTLNFFSYILLFFFDF